MGAVSGFCSSGVSLSHLAGLCCRYRLPYCAQESISFRSSVYLSLLHTHLAMWPERRLLGNSCIFFSVATCQRKCIPPTHTLGPMPLMNQKATYGGVSWKVPRTQLVPIKALRGSNVEDAERSPFSDVTYGSNRYKLRT